jgi:hypothetical protein
MNALPEHPLSIRPFAFTREFCAGNKVAWTRSDLLSIDLSCSSSFLLRIYWIQ